MADLKNQLVVVELVYHRVGGQSATTCSEMRFSRNLDSDEQPYPRQFTIDEEWRRLDCGWLKDNVGMLVISNLTGRNLQVNPTEEERQAIAAAVVEVSYYPEMEFDNWLVPPGESFRGYPHSPDKLFLRCQAGKARIAIAILPR